MVGLVDIFFCVFAVVNWIVVGFVIYRCIKYIRAGYKVEEEKRVRWKRSQSWLLKILRSTT